MKHVLPLAAVVVFTAASASAQVLFAPKFSSGSTPAGYTAVTAAPKDPNTGAPLAPPGTISYADGVMTSGDDSVNYTNAYITSTIATPNSSSINTQFTFTPHYTNGGAYGATVVPLINLIPNYGNNPILQVNYDVSDYVNQNQIYITSGVDFGGSTSTGNYIYAVSPNSSFNGVPLTIDITTTVTGPTGPNDSFVITNVGTVTNGSGDDLYDFDLVTTGNAQSSAYDPANTSLTLQVGSVGVSATMGVVNPGATTDISGVVVRAVPEPSTYALMFGGCGLLLLAVRHRRGQTGGRA